MSLHSIVREQRDGKICEKGGLVVFDFCGVLYCNRTGQTPSSTKRLFQSIPSERILYL